MGVGNSAFDAAGRMSDNRSVPSFSMQATMFTGQQQTAVLNPKSGRQAAFAVFLGLIGMGLTSGCGQSTYAERVNRTSEVFGYQNKLNQSLQGEWAKADWGIGMRVPLRFALMPAPPVPKPNEEGAVEIVADTRQPSYLGVELPGLVAAWSIPGEAFIYVCSNHQRFLDSQSGTAGFAAPENFFADLEATLQQGLEFTLSPDPARGPTEMHAKFAERIPPSDKFARPRDFQTIRINKEAQPRFTANVYEHTADKIQVAIILVYSPEFSTSPDRFESGLRTAMETLRVETVIPKRAATGGGVGGGAGGARGAF